MLSVMVNLCLLPSFFLFLHFSLLFVLFIVFIKLSVDSCKFSHHLVVQVGGVIGDYLLGNPYLQISSLFMNLVTTFLVTLA